jgi:hypothetical protein
VLRTSTALKRLKYLGEGKVAGLPPVRHGVGVAISVWYDEGAIAKRRAKTGWSGKLGRETRKFVR